VLRGLGEDRADGRPRASESVGAGLLSPEPALASGSEDVSISPSGTVYDALGATFFSRCTSSPNSHRDPETSPLRL
jgi:hypothetical protein